MSVAEDMVATDRAPAVALRLSRRRADIGDTAELVRMAGAFYAASGSAELYGPFSETYVVDRFRSVAYDRRWFIQVIARDGGGLAGMLVACRAQMPFAPVVAAQEVAWWVDPDARGTEHSAGLVADYEDWAGAVCRALSMACIEHLDGERVARALRRRGYRPAERHLVRALG